MSTKQEIYEAGFKAGVTFASLGEVNEIILSGDRAVVKGAYKKKKRRDRDLTPEHREKRLAYQRRYNRRRYAILKLKKAQEPDVVASSIPVSVLSR